MKTRNLLFILPVLLVACNKADEAKPTPAPAATSGTADGGSKPKVTAVGDTTGTTTGSTDTTKPSTPPPPLSAIPDALKTDAYHYYGLSNPKPMAMEITISDQPSQTFTGTQAATLKEIKDGVPIFSIERTGQLTQLGSQEVRLEADGIYNSMSSIAKIGDKDIELPSNLKPGTKWSSHAEISQGGQTIVNDSILTVVGPSKVTTKGGEHDALLITSTGQSTIGGQKAKTTSKNWYVLDLGVVKSVLVNTYPADPAKKAKEKVQTITIQETK